MVPSVASEKIPSDTTVVVVVVVVILFYLSSFPFYVSLFSFLCPVISSTLTCYLLDTFAFSQICLPFCASLLRNVLKFNLQVLGPPVGSVMVHLSM
jgi:hypothetical protein